MSRGEIHLRQTVVIAAGRIPWIAPSGNAQIPQGTVLGTVRVAGDGRYLMLGLWDMHVLLLQLPGKASTPLSPNLRLELPPFTGGLISSVTISHGHQTSTGGTKFQFPSAWK